MSRLIDACKSTPEDVTTVRSLLDAGADINIRDKYGRTALYWACHYNRTNIVPLLLDAGADINITNNNGYTALQYATRRGKTDIATLIRNHDPKKVSKDIEDRNG